jgi:hypothetical protein
MYNIALITINYPLIENYLHDLKNRRTFFIEFASKMGFDPLVSNNWYCVSKKLIKLEKVYISLTLLFVHYSTEWLIDFGDV